MKMTRERDVAIDFEKGVFLFLIVLSCHFYIVCCASWILKHFKMESMISFVAQLISVFLGVYLIIPILKKCKPALWGI